MGYAISDLLHFWIMKVARMSLLKFHPVKIHSCNIICPKDTNILTPPPGRGSGSFGGGLLIASLGTREAFRYMGLIAFLGGVLYGLLHYFWLRKIIITKAVDNSEHDNGESCIIRSLRDSYYR